MAMIPPWILDSPLKAGIQTMQAGAHLGLALRQQQAQEAEAADRMSLSFAEMQARREQAAAQLAESLRQHNALEQYRQSEMAHQKALEAQAQQQFGATQAHQALLQTNWTADHALRAAAEKRLEETAKESSDFKPGEPVPIMVDGKPMGYRTQRSPHIWEQVKPLPAAKTAADLTKTATVNALLRMAAPNSLGQADPTSSLYRDRTNDLARARALLSPSPSATIDVPSASTPTGVFVRRKSDGAKFRYKGSPSDVPADQFDILDQSGDEE